MPRGRPKGSKNKSTLMKMNLLEVATEEVQVTPQTEETVTKASEMPTEIKLEYTPKNSFVCQICNRTVMGSPYSLDFNRITGKADYHRDSRSKKMYVCNDCSKELSDVIDKWLLKKNPGLRKFPVEGVSDEEE